MMSRLLCGLCVMSLLTTGLAAEERGERKRHERVDDGRAAVRDAINAEFLDIAGAIRSLDQSYVTRGFSSGKAWTPGQCFIDPLRRCNPPVSLLGDCAVRRNCRDCVTLCWPQSAKCVVFRWRRGDDTELIQHGNARVDQVGVMELTGGALQTSKRTAADLLHACRESNELTVEAVFKSYNADQRGPTRIVTFSNGTGQRNFTLGQEGRSLVFRLRTSKTDDNGTSHQLNLGDITPGQWHHVVVSYRDGNFVCLLDGRETLQTDNLQGSFKNWSSQHLLFGDEHGGGRDWQGSVERVAIYRCFLERRAALANYLHATAPEKK